MGLDIYFHKVKKARKSSNESLKSIKEYVDILDKRAKDKFLRFSKKSIDKLSNAANNDEYEEIYHNIFDKQMERYTKWEFSYSDMKNKVYPLDDVKKFFSDFLKRYYAEDDAYFRKANFVYHYFSPKLEDEACFVTREDLEDLIDRCDRVLENHSLAEDLLPTQDGFFFGSTDYDKWYFEDVKDCRRQMKKLLRGFNEETDVIYVIMSW